MLSLSKNYRNFGTVFQVEVKEKVVQCNLSTSKKLPDGTYKNSNWRAAFVGDAKAKAEGLKDKDRIEILEASVETTYVKETDKTYVNLTIFDFKTPDELAAEKTAVGNTDPNA